MFSIKIELKSGYFSAYFSGFCAFYVKNAKRTPQKTRKIE